MRTARASYSVGNFDISDTGGWVRSRIARSFEEARHARKKTVGMRRARRTAARAPRSASRTTSVRITAGPEMRGRREGQIRHQPRRHAAIIKRPQHLERRFSRHELESDHGDQPACRVVEASRRTVRAAASQKRAYGPWTMRTSRGRPAVVRPRTTGPRGRMRRPRSGTAAGTMKGAEIPRG